MEEANSDAEIDNLVSVGIQGCLSVVQQNT